LEEIKAIGEKVLKSLADNPIGFPPSTLPRGTTKAQYDQFKFKSHFGTYHYAGAYMLYTLDSRRLMIQVRVLS
jgi:hypothetical protein